MNNLLNWAESYLANQNIANPKLEAEYLLSGFLRCQKIDLYLNKVSLNENREKAFLRLVKKRAQRVPLQILLNNTVFMDWTFLVKKGVFIPRLDSELLVEETYKIIEKFYPKKEIKILDLGTGTGNIAISLAKKFPKLKVYATDISSKALGLARENAEILKVKKQICFRQGNLFSAFKKTNYFEKFFLLTANLPYIPEDTIPTLPIEVKNFDPIQSLNGGKDGLNLYRKLLFKAWQYLETGGYIVLEIGETQAEKLRNLVKENFRYEFIRLIRDYQGQSQVVIIRNR